MRGKLAYISRENRARLQQLYPLEQYEEQISVGNVRSVKRDSHDSACGRDCIYEREQDFSSSTLGTLFVTDRKKET